MPPLRRSSSRVNALRLDKSSLLEAGMAFVLAYTAAYLFSVI